MQTPREGQELPLRSGRTWLLLFLAVTAWGVLTASQSYLLYKSYNQKTIPVVPLTVLALTQAWTWFALMPGILILAKRFPIQKPGLARNLTAHILAGAVFTLLDIAARALIESNMPWARPISFQSRFGNLLLTSFQSSLLVYWAIIGVFHTIAYYRRLEERERRASQLEANLAQAQLQVLRNRLQPHFLFNTLHAICTLVHKDPDAADHAITLLSDLLRMALESEAVQEIELQRELEIVQRYVEIEATRFGDRLKVRIEIPDDVRHASVPSFLLQPLVENAIRHGIASRSQGGRVEVIANRKQEKLELLIQDNGKGLGSVPVREGVGLANTRARLEQLYGDEASMTISEAAAGGVFVRIAIPFRSSRLNRAAGALA